MLGATLPNMRATVEAGAKQYHIDVALVTRRSCHEFIHRLHRAAQVRACIVDDTRTHFGTRELLRSLKIRTIGSREVYEVVCTKTTTQDIGDQLVGGTSGVKASAHPRLGPRCRPSRLG